MSNLDYQVLQKIAALARNGAKRNNDRWDKAYDELCGTDASRTREFSIAVGDRVSQHRQSVIARWEARAIRKTMPDQPPDSHTSKRL